MRTSILLSGCMVLLTLKAPAAQDELTYLFRTIPLPLDIAATDVAPGTIPFTSPVSIPVQEPAIAIYANGIAPTEGWTLEFRHSDARGLWSEWKEAETHRNRFGRFWARLAVPGSGTRQMQFRFRCTLARQHLTIRLFGLDVPDMREYAISEEAYTSVPQRPEGVLDSIPRPPMVSRDQWGAKPPQGTLTPHVPYRATLHHTAMNRALTLEEGIAEMQFIQEYHQQALGWRDIGYHFCIDDSGRVYEGNLEGYVGTHTAGANTGNLGVALLGSFSAEQPPTLMIQAATDLFAALVYEYSMFPDSLLAHRDHDPSTTCPGDAAYAKLEQIRTEVRRHVGFGAPYVSSPFPPALAKDVDPATLIWLHVRDAEEGVDIRTIKVWVKDTLATLQFTGKPADYVISLRNYGTLPPSAVVTVRVQASDLAVPSHTLDYVYSFQTKARDVITESNGLAGAINGTFTLDGSWSELGEGLSLPGMNPGGAIYAFGQAGIVKASVAPNVEESGDYTVSMASPASVIGVNALYRLVSSNGSTHDEVIEYNRKFVGEWAAISNATAYFEAGTPSSGRIELLIPPGTDGFLIIDGIRLQLKAAGSPPAMPELKYVRRNGAGNVEVGWFTSLEGDVQGYRVYESPDGRTWGPAVLNETVLSREDSVATLPAPSAGSTHYYRVAAVDTTTIVGPSGGGEPRLSDVSDIYGLHAEPTIRVLVVDAFDRIGSWPAPQHSFVRSFGDALAALGVGFASCANDAAMSGEVRLADYEAVVYFCGDDSDDDESVSHLEQLRLMEYLSAGGKLFITGSELGYDLARVGRPEAMAFQSLFKAEYIGDDSGVRTCDGVAGTVFEGRSFTFGVETADTYVDDYPDYIGPYGGSEPAILYAGGTLVAAVQYTGPFGWPSAGETARPAADGQLVYCGFACETISPPESRTDFMKRVLRYFDIATRACDVAGIPAELVLEQNFPNPFNPSTTIKYELPKSSAVRLSVFDMLGREVSVLVNDRREAGVHEVKFDGSILASGVYIYRLQAGDFVQAKRLVLLR